MAKFFERFFYLFIFCQCVMAKINMVKKIGKWKKRNFFRVDLILSDTKKSYRKNIRNSDFKPNKTRMFLGLNRKLVTSLREIGLDFISFSLNLTVPDVCCFSNQLKLESKRTLSNFFSFFVIVISDFLFHRFIKNVVMLLFDWTNFCD